MHSLLVKKLADTQVESYTRWLREHKQEQSVLSLRDWLQEEVRIRVAAVEMAHGIAAEPVEVARASGKRVERGGGSRTLFSTDNDQRRETLGPTPKPPCVHCGGNHGVWSCRQFQSLGVDKRWEAAKDKHLCFRCLASNHEGRDCTRARACDINGCRRNHHYLLHETVRVDLRDQKTVSPREGAPTRAHTAASKQEAVTEAYSLRTVPMWLKANDHKVKVNAILDDGSNETFLNEEVAGILGLKESYQTVTVNVLNNEVETFQSMPLEVTVESLDGEFSEDIKVKTCPQQVTRTYKAENRKQSHEKWPHLTECDFPQPAQDGLVDLLIGVDNAELHYSRADVRGKEGGPVARLGPLGWTCIGSPEGGRSTETTTHISRTLLTREPLTAVNGVCCDIDHTLKRFWEVENCGTESCDTKIFTEEESETLRKLGDSISYTGERYKVGVLRKDNKPELPDNRHTAMSRL